jgi:glutathione synthase/RimK-type ligase-like ATP-grasp enzyme
MTRPSSPRVALITSAAYADLTPEDRLLAQALTEIGVRAVIRCWDDPEERWEDYDALVVRSCWDYHLRAEEFSAWLDVLEHRRARLFNPLPTVRWNMRKTYLQDLVRAGIDVVPTAWVERGDERTLTDLLAVHGWREAVVKPTISATAFETWRTGPEPTTADEHRFLRLVRQRDMMIQPYLGQIETGGELSLVFLDGIFSHAVRKMPRPGDFRVQMEFGGTEEAVELSDRLIRQAARVAAETPARCLYARVDGCTLGERFVLMELEAIEPTLFLGHHPRAVARFAEAIRGACE